jgi:2-dehydro-3-deoxyphosphooctonate aldolase (KDO 8-P synthase)
MQIAQALAACAQTHTVPVYFKASFDKANRTDGAAFRGPGMKEGLEILERVKKHTGLPILTDIHTPQQAIPAADVADVLQIPAFLCRQSDLITAAAATGRCVNIKKGQFMAPEQMRAAIQKAGEAVWLTERGTFFGYNRLVVDYAGLSTMLSFGCPVVFDATHSVQLPGAGMSCSLGNREFVLPLARAALAVGVHGLFFEVHPDPDTARCDGANMLSLDTFTRELPRLISLYEYIHSRIV